MKKTGIGNGIMRGFRNRGAAWLFALLLVPVKPVRASVDMWPFYEKTASSTTVLYPFHVREGEFQMNFPFYYRTNEGRDYHFLWPLVKISEGRVARVAPFWFSGEEESFTFFPFIRQTPEYTFWFIPPVYFRKDGDFSAVFPLYIRTRHRLFVFPGYYSKTLPDERVRALFPFFTYRKTPAGTKVTIALVSGFEKGIDRSASWFWPLYSKSRDPDGEDFRLLTYYRENRTRSKTSMFFPLYRFGEKLRHDGSREKSTLILWPFYSKKETYSASGRMLERRRRFLVFSDEIDRRGVRTFRVLGIPVAERMG